MFSSEQMINIFILGIEEMKFCCKISHGIKTHSHGNIRDRNGLINEVDTIVLIKFIHVFNGLNHWGYIDVNVPFKKVGKS